jgi:ADP-ribose pyrophosphatase YjhB (NUDIX family)
MPTEIRRAARVIILDRDDRLLLLRYDEERDGVHHVYWAVPGGSLEADESHDQAARRELREELGLAYEGTFGPPVAQRAKEHVVGDKPVRQTELYYLVRIDAGDIDVSTATQPDAITAYRWWTRTELAAATDPVYPLGLLDLVTDHLTHGTPQHPITLPG